MKKVLIVEDQRMPRENMERILLDSGKYALSASVNGADVCTCRMQTGENQPDFDGRMYSRE